MSIAHCNIHGLYDTDFHLEGCPLCPPKDDDTEDEAPPPHLCELQGFGQGFAGEHDDCPACDRQAKDEIDAHERAARQAGKKA